MMRNYSLTIAISQSVFWILSLCGSQTVTASPALSQPDVQATLKQYHHVS
jgi:hypothetical protein